VRDMARKSRIDLARTHSRFDTKFRVTPRGAPRLNDVSVDCAAGSGEDFRFSPLALGHFLMGSAYAQLQQIDTGKIKLTNVTRYKRVCSILEHFLRRLVAALSTHLDGWTSKTGGASPTTEAVHLSMMDCVNTSGFLLAVEGLLALGARPSGFITDGGADCREGDPAVRDIEAKGSDRLSKSAVALRHRVSVCASEGSTWDNESGRPIE
jgi:hypothetical protein